MSISIRRPKWTPPPPPTPRILQLPRRTTRRKPLTRKPIHRGTNLISRGDTPALLDNERAFSSNVPPVVLLNSGRRDGDVEERRSSDVEERERWRFQADMLRAECCFLRMEREVAVKELENERCFLRRSLNSAVSALVSGKKKIEEGEKAGSVLEEEIEELSKKLVELQRRNSRQKNPDAQNCINFDKQASELQKQLEKYKETNHSEGRVEETKDSSSVSSLPTDFTTERKIKVYGGSTRQSIRPTDVETLRRKMERLSKGKLLKRMEEVYGSILSVVNFSVPGSASSSRRFDLDDPSSQLSQEAKSGEIKACSGQCKAIVKRIMEQVKAETEQWSQMQEMLGQVREEMEEFQSSRDFWEARALESDHQIQTLHSEAREWKQKTDSFKIKENKLQKQVQELQQQLEKLSFRETGEAKAKAGKILAPTSLGAQLAIEKHGLTCRVKERNTANENMKNDSVNGNSKPGSSVNRTPFNDIGNLSALGRQNSRRYVYPLHSSSKDS